MKGVVREGDAIRREKGRRGQNSSWGGKKGKGKWLSLRKKRNIWEAKKRGFLRLGENKRGRAYLILRLRKRGNFHHTVLARGKKRERTACLAARKRIHGVVLDLLAGGRKKKISLKQQTIRKKKKEREATDVQAPTSREKKERGGEMRSAIREGGRNTTEGKKEREPILLNIRGKEEKERRAVSKSAREKKGGKKNRRKATWVPVPKRWRYRSCAKEKAFSRVSPKKGRGGGEANRRRSREKRGNAIPARGKRRVETERENGNRSTS